MNFLIKIVLLPLMVALMVVVIACSLVGRVLETLARLFEVVGRSVVDFMQALADRANCR